MEPTPIGRQPHLAPHPTTSTSLDSLNQDHRDIETHGFNPHAVSTTTSEPPNPFDTTIQQYTPSNITHEIPYQEHVTTPHSYESELPPHIWARMSDKERRHHTTRTRKNKSKKNRSTQNLSSSLLTLGGGWKKWAPDASFLIPILIIILIE